mgnify:CR=1 FL=1
MKISDKEFNSHRKIILEALDKNETISNALLDFYDLTTYTKEEDFDSSLLAKTFEYKKENRRILHINDQPLFFSPEQEEMISKIKQNKRILFSAPTSFGKTLIVKEYIYRTKPNCVVFIVPTNALAYEVENDLRTNSSFDDYDVFDRVKTDSTSDFSKKLLFVGTQEKFSEWRSIFDRNIDLFIIDEAYKLKDPIASNQRSYILTKSFIEDACDKSDKVILLSPCADFLGFDKYNFVQSDITFNLVDRSFHKISKDIFYSKLYEEAKTNKTILYCKKPADMVNLANTAPVISQVNNDFISHLEKEFHKEWSVVKLLKKGILTHHGQMPKYVQNRMLRMFNSDKTYNLLIGTNSISEGINTATKNVFIDVDEQSVQKDVLLIKNTIGRAGRLGRYPIGHIFSYVDLEQIDRDNTLVELSASNDDNLEIINDSKNDNKIDFVAEQFSLTSNFLKEMMKKYNFYLSKIEIILKVFKEDLRCDSFDSVIGITAKCFDNKETNIYNYKKCQTILKGVLQSFYCINNSRHSLSTYQDKINFYRLHIDGNETDSAIVEKYISFSYSTLDYYIYPLANFCKDLAYQFPNFSFGANVKDCFSNFRKKYFFKFFNGIDLDNITDNQNKILSSLKEMGISINRCNISTSIIQEIEMSLKQRYSSYDIVNAIIKLMSTSNNSSVYTFIYKNYLN